MEFRRLFFYGEEKPKIFNVNCQLTTGSKGESILRM